MNPPDHLSDGATHDATDSAATPDPFQQLDDLMYVVEQFCPVWPERAIVRTDPKLMRL